MRSGAVQNPLTWEDDNIHVPVRDWVPLVHAFILFEIYSIIDYKETRWLKILRITAESA